MRPILKETLDFINRARGRPTLANPKQAVSLRLDQDVIEHFKKSGPGWQGRINAALRKQAKLKS
ncbi:MAG: BrnA antitoxin family protein [Hyphomonadaceae bacterium]|nr:BrnA antitoxin family protein [Hyphomonadaceae bacterium]